MSARYIQLSEQIIDDIDAGKLTIGQRMPSIRSMTQQHQVSMTTVISCYHRLEEQGWLHAKPQSGFFISRPLNMSAVPEYVGFKAQVAKPRNVSCSNPSLYSGPFYTAQLSSSLVPFQVLNRAQQRACQRFPEQLLQYPQIQGSDKLRAVLAAHFSQHYFALSPDKLVISNGCMAAVRTALEITTKPGDVVAVSSPCFNGLLDLLQSMQRLVVEIPCHSSGLDLLQLEEQLSSGKVRACLLSASFINPQGISLSVAQKKRIIALAQQYKVPIIEDDVYLELGFNKVAPLPIKHWDKHGWVLWCGSISKTIGAGYRLGWCEAGRYLDQYLSYLSGSSFGVNNIAQVTIAEFISSGQYAKHLKKLKLTLASHALDYHQLLRQNLGAKAKISAIQGGLVLWVQVLGLDSEALLEKANDAGIYIKAGKEFTSRSGYKDCFRLNIGWPLLKEPALVVPVVKPSADGFFCSEVSSTRSQLIALCELVDGCVD